MGLFIEWSDRLDRLGLAVAGMTIAAMVAVTFIETLSRSLFGSSLLPADEIAALLLPIAGLAAAGNTLRHNAHISANFGPERLSLRGRAVLHLITCCVALVFLSYWVWCISGLALSSLKSKEASLSRLEIPLWLPQGALWLALLIFAIAMLARIVRILRGELSSFW